MDVWGRGQPEMEVPRSGSGDDTNLTWRAPGFRSGGGRRLSRTGPGGGQQGYRDPLLDWGGEGGNLARRFNMYRFMVIPCCGRGNWIRLN